MRLIDCDECKRHALEQVLQAGEPLGGGVEQAQFSAACPREYGALRVCGHGAVETGGGNARLLQSLYLVFHQRDERGDDKRQSGDEQCWHLIAHRFARAGRHNAEHVAPLEQRVHQFFLPPAKGAVAEVFF